MSPARRQFLISTLIPIVLALGSVLLSAFTSYTSNDKQLEHRITVIETDQKNDHDLLRETHEEVHQLYQQMLGR